MLKEKAPKCVSSFLGPGWIVSEQEKDQWEGGILSKTSEQIFQTYLFAGLKKG